MKQALVPQIEDTLINDFAEKNNMSKEATKDFFLLSGGQASSITTKTFKSKRVNSRLRNLNEEEKKVVSFYNERDKLVKAALGYLVSSLKRVAVILCNSIVVDRMQKLETETLEQIVTAADSEDMLKLIEDMQFSVHEFCDVCSLLQVCVFVDT